MHILGVGVATLDIIDSLAAYPVENSEQRALARRVCRGGNAANTLVVLSQLGHACSWAGTLADDAAAGVIVGDLAAHGIDTHWATRLPGGVSPTSYILLSRATASRTIIHYRELAEFSHQAFARIDLSPFDWIHFEGRHIPDCEVMLMLARERGRQARISLEVEKPREGIERLFPLAEVLIFSRAYAEARGQATAQGLFEWVRRSNRHALLFAGWGETGGWLDAGAGPPLHRPSVRPPKLVDTLGAGDVFNAGVIHGLLQGGTPAEALELAVELSGRKCGQSGFQGLGIGHG
jgi:ketohexokinase